MLLATIMLGLGLTLADTLPAAASSLPKTQTAGMGGTWSGIWRVRPHMVDFGSYFFIKNLRYRYYTGTHAYAHGRLLIDNCRPDCAHAGYFVNATAYFWNVFYYRDPGRNFRISQAQVGRNHIKLLWINSAGLGLALRPGAYPVTALNDAGVPLRPWP